MALSAALVLLLLVEGVAVARGRSWVMALARLPTTAVAVRAALLVALARLRAAPLLA